MEKERFNTPIPKMNKIFDLLFLFYVAGETFPSTSENLKKDFLKGKHVIVPKRVWRRYAESNKDM